MACIYIRNGLIFWGWIKVHFGLTFGACIIASVSYTGACTTMRGNKVRDFLFLISYRDFQRFLTGDLPLDFNFVHFSGEFTEDYLFFISKWSLVLTTDSLYKRTSSMSHFPKAYVRKLVLSDFVRVKSNVSPRPSTFTYPIFEKSDFWPNYPFKDFNMISKASKNVKNL